MSQDTPPPEHNPGHARDRAAGLPERPRIAVVGAGALGGYYGARLAQAGHEVHFLLRGDFEHVSRHGLRIESCDGDFTLSEVNAARDSAGIGPCDLVIISLKTTANDVMPELVAPLVGQGTILLTLQNGLGSDELLAARFGAGRVLAGLCFVCINRLGPGHIAHTAEGLIRMGEFSGPAGARADALAALLNDAGIPCRVEASLAAAQWRKLVWNIPFNGLSIAAGGLDTAAILAEPTLEALCRELMREVIAASAGHGHPLPDLLVDEQITRTHAMNAYLPSSLIDWLGNRPVEVESIWGEPLRRARRLGRATPRLEMLYQLLVPLCDPDRPRAAATSKPSDS